MKRERNRRNKKMVKNWPIKRGTKGRTEKNAKKN